MEIRYNHKRPLSDFDAELKIIREAGFNPVAVSQMHFEDTFVFNTDAEALEAYSKLEESKPRKVVGWWYGIDRFKDAVKKYETENKGYSKVLIYWFNK